MRRMPIRPLPALLVNQIAAGEVIERPASVVKELVENAIDAGATRIDVEIEDGGRELIRVRDDGRGIPMEELALAVSPHATSKIEKQEDLDAISTMGFRGEALASIASVSRMTILSRTAEQEGAGRLDAEGAAIGEVMAAGGPVGTTVTVRNLFFNTPARRKFLRTAVTETSRIAEMVEAIALAHPRLGFTLTSNGRSKLDLPPDATPRRRALDILGGELEDQLLEVSADFVEERGLSMWGLIGLPGIARGTANHQRLYVNGRPIRDRSLQHALKEAYRGLIEPGRYPTLLLFLEIDPRQVDVNVHPTKAEVRFRNQSAAHGAVLRVVRDRLRQADLTPAYDLNRGRSGWPAPTFGSGLHGESDAATAVAPPPPQRPITSTSDFVDYFKRLDPTQKGFVYTEVKQALADTGGESAGDESRESADRGDDAADDAAMLPAIRRAAEILQLHSSYIVTQDERGLVIIDQHALHERVMFEKLMARVGERNLESQRLLMPEIVEVDRAMVERLDELRPLFVRIGVEAEAMGPASIAVHAFPSFLFERNVEAGPFLSELLERHIEEGFGEDVEAALHEVLDMMACKAAVKAGDHLSDDELKELLRHRDAVERASNCPHGRPTTLRLSIDDLNRQFGRT